MRQIRLVAFMIAIVYITQVHNSAEALWYYCDMLCGPEASCDEQCVWGGSNITCGQWTDPNSLPTCDPGTNPCQPNWVATNPQTIGALSEYWTHFDFEDEHLDCRTSPTVIYLVVDTVCDAQPYEICVYGGAVVHHDVTQGYCESLNGPNWGEILCPF